MVQKIGVMGQLIQANIIKEKNMELELILGQMELNMKDSGQIIVLEDMAYIIFLITKFILENGKIKKRMDLVNLFGLIGNIQDFLRMIKKMELVLLYGKMEIKQSLDFGKKGNNLVLENI